MLIEETQLEDHLYSIKQPDWERLFALIPELENKEVFGRWEGSDQWPYLVPEQEVHQFCESVYALGLVVVYDWSRWPKGKEAWQTKSYDFHSMTLPELCKMITLLVRADRFNEGLLVEAFDRGLILGILKAVRAKVPHFSK